MHASGAATGERSYCPALAGLLDAVGGTLKPKVFCVSELADQGAAHPACALFTAGQVQRGRPRRGQVPERGVVEVKGVGNDAWLTAESNQVTRYWGRYRLVLVTNLRSFVLVGADDMGGPAKLETFRLAKDADDFWRKVETPRAFARDVGTSLGEYLIRALSHRAALAEPKDLAWLLASYARDGLARIAAASNIPSIRAVRSAMEEALGIRFEREQGNRFLRSTLIQTLLFPVSFPGVKTSRDGFLVDTDLDRLRARVGEYFDPALSHEEIARRYPRVMKSTARFNACAVRDSLLGRGGPDESGFVRFAYRPFDNRWLYWEKDTKLLDEKRADDRPHVFGGSVWIEAREREAKKEFSRGTLVVDLADNFGNGLSSWYPTWLRVDDGLATDGRGGRRANLTDQAKRYLGCLDLNVEDLFYLVVATLHDPAYRESNTGALRMAWPRIPLPGWPDGEADGAAQAFARSAAHGRSLAALLDPRTAVPGVTQAPLRTEIAAIAVPTTVRGRNMAGDDFAVTAGWGRFGASDAVMPGKGRTVERAYAPAESAAMRNTLSVLGDTTIDVHLNGKAFWRNVPSAVWEFRLGGYQVLKKWLSYRERTVLGRRLRAEEVRHFTDSARRIGGVLLAARSRLPSYDPERCERA
ncbi:MAG: hypothetical protein OXH99_17280 [Bryobacterales bacterium]|nr:hypothetical protein [Bryobacterales bacterium]